MDDAVKSMLAHRRRARGSRFLLQVEDLHAAPELIALAVNLTHDDRRCAAAIREDVRGRGGRGAVSTFSSVARCVFAIPWRSR